MSMSDTAGKGSSCKLCDSEDVLVKVGGFINPQTEQHFEHVLCVMCLVQMSVAASMRKYEVLDKG